MYIQCGISLIRSVTTVNEWFSKDQYLGNYLKISCWVFPLFYDITHLIQNFNVGGKKVPRFPIPPNKLTQEEFQTPGPRPTVSPQSTL